MVQRGSDVMGPSEAANKNVNRKSQSQSQSQRGNMKCSSPDTRKYVVLYDCLAVKFCTRRSKVSEHFGNTGTLGQPTSVSASTSLYDTTNINKNNNLESTSPTFFNGVALFKGFRDANLKCYWNGAIVECFQNIEFRGFCLPSTIFISALPKFAQILRNAWARKMIQSAPEYQIQFIGEIQEILCEPIKQSQWSPLSDSLCWTILEMTGRGEEAFVDTICGALAKFYPLMAQPSRELVYQTLEQLTRERKVYQTNRGYFIVTPDTFRYISSAAPGNGTGTGTSMNKTNLPMSSSQDFSSVSHSYLTLDALINSHQEEVLQSQTLRRNTEKQAMLKRHNSLKVFRQKEHFYNGIGAQNFAHHHNHRNSLGARSLSLRFSKSIPYSVNVQNCENGGEIDPTSFYEDQLTEQLEFDNRGSGDADETASDIKIQQTKNKKGEKQSLLSKIFGFGRWSTKKKGNKKGGMENDSGGSTLVDGDFSVDSCRSRSRSRPSTIDDLESGCFTLERTLNSMDDEDDEHFNHHNNHHYETAHLSTGPKWNSLPKRRSYRSTSRRSIITMVDNDNDNDQMHMYNDNTYANPSSTCTSGSGVPFPRAQSCRSSTFSGSLGYQSASQGPVSPCVSTTETYASIHNNNNNNNPQINKNDETNTQNNKNSTIINSKLIKTSSPKPVYETIANNNNSSNNNNNNNSSNNEQKEKTNSNNNKKDSDPTPLHTLTHKSTTTSNTEIELHVPFPMKKFSFSQNGIISNGNNKTTTSDRSDRMSFSIGNGLSIEHGNTQIRLDNQKPKIEIETISHNNNIDNSKSKKEHSIKVAEL